MNTQELNVKPANASSPHHLPHDKHCPQTLSRAPQRRYSLVQPFNELFRKSIGEMVSRVDWVQVNHYMDKLA